MPEIDDENLDLVRGQGEVDALNRDFYGRFPYPWPPASFPRVADGGLERTMLNQSIGSWANDRAPPGARIWVAGCGTNQAIYTALKFPDAQIVASDISVSSLEISQATARALGLANIEFRQESLNGVEYDGAFDHIICTGVIHHNADPAVPLARIARALKPRGVLELMVYNRFHRLLTSAVQKTVRIFSRAAGQETDFDAEFRIAKAVIDAGPLPAAVKADFANSPDARFADSWLQPVEHSYTIESLGGLVAGCGLRLLTPCLTHFDFANGSISWDTGFGDPATQAQYEALSDLDRWQVGNLLLGGRSPMLWFYLGKAEAGDPENLERAVCARFLDLPFSRVSTSEQNFVRDAEGGYSLHPAIVPYPRPVQNPLVRRVIEKADPARRMGDILQRLGVDTANRKQINEIRVQTTSPLCPYLRVVAPPLPDA